MACRCGRWRPGKAVGALLVLWLALALCGCASTKKNTAATRNYNAFITRYNIYYNGDTHYRETLQKMEESYEDDYSRLVLMHPVEAKGREQTPQPTGNFDRSIEKGQKAIQLRSIKKRPRRKPGKSGDPAYQAWLKRDEYNPFLHNAWMMMGRSQFFNGDFLGAASTFFYISRHFSWLPQTVTEAKLWQARSYVAMDWLYDAELILERLKPDQLTTPALRGLYAYVKADCLVRGGHYEEAVEPLREAIKAASGAQRTRLRFLLGQVLERLGRRKEAYEAFGKAGASSSATYRTKFNARIKQSEVYDGTDIEPEVRSLRRMTRYDRNKPYLDQIYYAIGNLYLSRADTAHAIENYALAAAKSERNGIDKALAQLRLGGLYFDRRQYAKAQPCYSEAVPQLPRTYPDYEAIKRRSDVLDELAVYSQNVELQDSLLRLAAMPEDERMKVIQGIIDELVAREKREAEEARRAEYEADVASRGDETQSGANAPTTFNINTDNSWYFYNPTAKQAGRTEFQKRWGSRRLEDDWRRRNKATFNTSDFDSPDADGEDGSEDDADSQNSEKPEDNLSDEEREKLEHASDPHYPEYYLAQIPQSDEERQTAHDVIQEGLYNMGVILKDKLEDFDAAGDEFNRLLSDYPDNVYRLDTYYNLYLMYMRMGDALSAEKYRDLILSDFPESSYGMALRDPKYLDNLRDMDRVQQELYDRTYQAYLENRNAEVHRGYEEMESRYPLSKIMPKFMFLHALALVTEKKTEDFNAVLRQLLERYPDTDITPIASAWLKGMAQGRELQTAQSGNLRGMIWDMRLTNDTTATADGLGPAVFDLNPDTRQLLVFTFATDEIPTNLLLYEIARHNFGSFVVKDFDLEQMNFGRLGMIVVRGFENLDELNHYRRVMADSPDFKLFPGVKPIAISAANFDKLLSEGRSFDEYFHYLEEQNYIDAQADLLQPEEVETLSEADEAETPPEVNGAEAETVTEEQPTEPALEEPATKQENPTNQPDTTNQAPKNITPAEKPENDPALMGSEGDDPLFDDD